MQLSSPPPGGISPGKFLNVKKSNKMRNTHILWATHNRNHWERAFIGSREECQKEMDELSEDGYGYEIHANKVKDSWNNVVTGMHFDTYMDDTTVSRAMTEEEIAADNF